MINADNDYAKTSVNFTDAEELVKIRFKNYNIYLRKAILSDYWVFEGIFYAEEYWPVKISKNSMVLDVGSNIGISALWFIIKGADNVIAIEPEPRNYTMLKINICSNRLNNRVKTLNVAVSDKNEILYFNATGGSATALKSPENKNSFAVKAYTLDEILEKFGNPEINILKMDIEGYEVKVLSNFKKYQEINQVIVETHSQELTLETIKILKKWGLTVIDVSRVNRLRVFKNILTNLPSFLITENNYNYSTVKALLKFYLHLGPSPVSADNPASSQKILYAFKSMNHI